MHYTTTAQIKQANAKAGGKWFSKNNMEYFNTIIVRQVFGGRYFITSERDGWGMAWDGRRRYSIRMVDEDAQIETVGEFGQYATKEAAIKAARRIVEEQMP